MRSYIRVDYTEIRAVETRYFIDFEDNNSIIRRFDCLGAKWEDIIKKGFRFDPCFNLDMDQADKIVPFLTNVHSSSQKISFN